MRLCIDGWPPATDDDGSSVAQETDALARAAEGCVRDSQNLALDWTIASRNSALLEFAGCWQLLPSSIELEFGFRRQTFSFVLRHAAGVVQNVRGRMCLSH